MAVLSNKHGLQIMQTLLALQINIYYQHNNFAYVFINTRTKAEFFRLAGSTVVIEYKNKSIITAIRIIEFGEKTTKFILLNSSYLRYCGIRTSQVIIRLGSVIQKILADLQLGIFKVRILDNPVGLISLSLRSSLSLQQQRELFTVDGLLNA